MTVPARLATLERRLADVGTDRCPTCPAPVRWSPLRVADARTNVGGLCPTCGRLLDHDGHPFGPAVHLVILDDDATPPRLLDRGYRRGLAWAADGERVRLDARRCTLIDGLLADAMGLAPVHKEADA